MPARSGIGWGRRVGSCCWSLPLPEPPSPAPGGAGTPGAAPAAGSRCCCAVPVCPLPAPGEPALRSMGTVSELCASSFQAFLCPSVAAAAGRCFVPSAHRSIPVPPSRPGARSSGSIWLVLTAAAQRVPVALLPPSPVRCQARAPASPGLRVRLVLHHVAGMGCWGASGSTVGTRGTLRRVRQPLALLPQSCRG